jgi:hypothetical protein
MLRNIRRVKHDVRKYVEIIEISIWYYAVETNTIIPIWLTFGCFAETDCSL